MQVDVEGLVQEQFPEGKFWPADRELVEEMIKRAAFLADANVNLSETIVKALVAKHGKEVRVCATYSGRGKGRTHAPTLAV